MGATVPFDEPLDEGRDFIEIVCRVTIVKIELDRIPYAVVINNECANFIIDAGTIRFPHTGVQQYVVEATFFPRLRVITHESDPPLASRSLS